MIMKLADRRGVIDTGFGTIRVLYDRPEYFA